MATITLTRHFNGFTNVADRFSIGDNEHQGHAAATAYTLPQGYSTENGAIYDSAGIQCEVIVGERGEPVLMSLMGTCADQRLVAC